ncbi:MAG: hypothetical protein ABIK47_03195 [candidate division WOR-3 bacterium]
MSTKIAPLVAISSEIGRGHPNYLDSVLFFMPAVEKIVPSGFGWTLARKAYYLGARGGLFTTIYNRSRQGSKPSRIELFLLDSGLRARFQSYQGIILVDHPLLAHLLSPFSKVAYLHGEIAAPPICAVPEAWRIFVPLEFTARKLQQLGVNPEALSVTGLVIEPELLPVAEVSFQMRLQRYASREPLTVAFFTSGAYPKPHCRAIITAARSAIKAGHKTVIFAGTDKNKAKPLPSALFFNSRKEENQNTAELLSEIDLIVAAAHERTNWAIGLGLPLFALLPHIGPFAKENFQFAYEQGVCLPLTNPERFGSTIDELRKTGKLIQMACAGWGKYPLTGAKAVAEFLLSN